MHTKAPQAPGKLGTSSWKGAEKISTHACMRSFFFKGGIGRRCFFDGKVTGFEAAAVDDGAVGNGVFTGGKRWESGGITVFFYGLPASEGSGGHFLC